MKENIILEICKLFTRVYLQVMVCFIRSFIWAIPVKILWNNVIAHACGFECLTYWNSYWICVMVMSMFTAMISTRTGTEQKN